MKDQLPEALAEFRKAAELDPAQSDVHYTLGDTLWQQGNFDKPDYAPAHLHLAEALQRQKFQRAAQLDPRLQTSTPWRLMNRCATQRCSIPPGLLASPSPATGPRTASSLLSVKHSNGSTSLSTNSRCIQIRRLPGSRGSWFRRESSPTGWD